MRPIDQLKLRAGIEGVEHHRLLNLLLDDAAAFIQAYIGRKPPAELEGVQVRLALHAWNQRGAEGESATSAGGVSHTFDPLPSDIERQLNAWRVAKVVGLYADA